jgi:hypothetical protein
MSILWVFSGSRGQVLSYGFGWVQGRVYVHEIIFLRKIVQWDCVALYYVLLWQRM